MSQTNDRLLKILRLTTSPNDHEALAAIRKANEMLSSNDTSWDKLISATDEYNKLVDRYNVLVRKYNRSIGG